MLLILVRLDRHLKRRRLQRLLSERLGFLLTLGHRFPLLGRGNDTGVGLVPVGGIFWDRLHVLWLMVFAVVFDLWNSN